MTLTFDMHIGTRTHLVFFVYQLSLTTKVSDKSIVLTFSHTKSQGTKLVLPLNISRSNKGHYLNKPGRTRTPNPAYHVSRSSAFWFRRILFTVFIIYGHGGHIGHVHRTI